MNTGLIIAIIVLAILAVVVASVKNIIYPKSVFKDLDSIKKYVEKVRTGEIPSMHFKDFQSEYNKNKKQFILGEIPKIMRQEPKKTGRGTQLVPRSIHFPLIDRLKYNSWYKKIKAEVK